MKFKGLTAAVAVCGLACAGAIVCLIANYNSRAVQKNSLIEYRRQDTSVTEAETECSTIIVYITGEVKKPGVYSMLSAARLNDLIEKAGGFTAEAYKDNLNLAKHLEDGEKIVVDNANEAVDKNLYLDENKEAGLDAEEELININTADSDRLQKLDGIGESLAQAIIDYREKYGDFTSKEEIREVDGIGKSLFAKIEDKITID